jgi:hypothetical protein
MDGREDRAGVLIRAPGRRPPSAFPGFDLDHDFDGPDLD